MDPELCRSHAAMAAWNLFGAWNWSEAEASSRRAVEINPSDGRARMVLAACHLVLNRPDEAAEELRQALRLDPLSPVIGSGLVVLGFLARSYDRAIEGCQKLLSHDPSSALMHMMLGACFARKGDYTPALTHCEKAKELGQRPDHLYRDALFCVCGGGSSNFCGAPSERVGRPGQTTIRAIYLPGAGCGQPGKQRANLGVDREGL